MRLSNKDSWMPLILVLVLAAASAMVWNMEKGHPFSLHLSGKYTDINNIPIFSRLICYIFEPDHLDRGDTDNRYEKSYE